MDSMLTALITYIAAIAIGYTIGSIPFSLIVAKIRNIGDLRALGSGNIGATNVLRNSDLPTGAIALLLDMSKGIMPFLIMQNVFHAGHSIATFSSLVAVVGHIYPVWLGFSGGKGVATFLGAMLISNPSIGFLSVLSWILMFLLFGYSSVSSIICLLFTSSVTLIFCRLPIAMACITIACLIGYRHKDNMSRFLNGKEKRLYIFNKKR